MPAGDVGSIAESFFILWGRSGWAVGIEADDILGGWRLVQAVRCVWNLSSISESSARETAVSINHFQSG